MRQKNPTWNRHNSHVVETPMNRLLGVDGSWLRQKLGISVFIKTAPVVKLLSWQQHYGCHFAMKGDITEHFDVFRSTMSQLHGYNTRKGCMPQVRKPRTEWGKNKTYNKVITDWASLPKELKRERDLCQKGFLNTN